MYVYLFFLLHHLKSDKHFADPCLLNFESNDTPWTVVNFMGIWWCSPRYLKIMFNNFVLKTYYCKVHFDYLRARDCLFQMYRTEKNSHQCWLVITFIPVVFTILSDNHFFIHMLHHNFLSLTSVSADELAWPDHRSHVLFSCMKRRNL